MSVLLLNACYTPIRVVSMKRAVSLILQEKADSVVESERIIRSENITLNLPEVIRLRYYVNVPYKGKVPLTKRGILTRDRHRCVYCNEKATTVDHIIPSSRGGKNSWENLVAACKKCNSKKADKTLSQLGWKLDYVPFQPEGRMWFVLGSVPVEKESRWGEWLHV